MPLDPLLIEVLACPVDKGPLLWFEDEDLLYNARLKKAYAVRDGIPILLVDEATDVAETEHERLMGKAAAGGVPETGSGGARPGEAGSGETGSSGDVGASGVPGGMG